MSRPPILFLPGMMCDRRVFSPQYDFLHQRSWPHAVVDLSQGGSIASMAKASLNEAEKQGWENILVCGLSMGGIVAMELMKQRAVTGVILIDTNHLADTPEKRARRDRQNQEVLEAPSRLDEIIKEEMKPFYLAEKKKGESQTLKHLFYDMAITLGREVFVRQNLALRNRDSYEDVLRTFKKECLIICGDSDSLCPPDQHRAMGQLITRSELHVIPLSGHVANLDNPDQVNQVIGKWLEKYQS